MSNIEGVMTKGTNVVAAGGLASPLWLPSLEQVSQTAALMLPVASLAWIVVQIVLKVREYRRAAAQAEIQE